MGSCVCRVLPRADSHHCARIRPPHAAYAAQQHNRTAGAPVALRRRRGDRSDRRTRMSLCPIPICVTFTRPVSASAVTLAHYPSAAGTTGRTIRTSPWLIFHRRNAVTPLYGQLCSSRIVLLNVLALAAATLPCLRRRSRGHSLPDLRPPPAPDDFFFMTRMALKTRGCIECRTGRLARRPVAFMSS